MGDLTGWGTAGSQDQPVLDMWACDGQAWDYTAMHQVAEVSMITAPHCFHAMRL